MIEAPHLRRLAVPLLPLFALASCVERPSGANFQEFAESNFGGVNCVVEIRPRPKPAPTLLGFHRNSNDKTLVIDVTPSGTGDVEATDRLIPVTLGDSTGNPIKFEGMGEPKVADWEQRPWRAKFESAGADKVKVTISSFARVGLRFVGTTTLSTTSPSGAPTWSYPISHSTAITFESFKASLNKQVVIFSLVGS